MHGLTDAYYKSNYYVHYHKENIGKLINSSSNVNDLINIYEQQKQKAIADSRGIYKNEFLLNINADGINLLNSAMDLNEDEVFNELVNTIGEELQQSINIDNLIKLANIRKGIETDISNLLKPKEEGLQAFNNILNGISEALKLLDDPNASALAASLLNAVEGRSGAFYMGNRLQRALNSFKIKNNGKLIENKSLQTVINRLNNLAIAMKTKTTVRGNILTSENIKRSVHNILNKDIGKSLAIMIDSSANAIADNEVVNAIVNAPNTTFTDENGNSGIKQSSISGESQIKMSNLNININGNSNNNNGNIDINLGINAKFYENQPFPDLQNGGEGVYRSNSGGTLKEALIELFGNDITQNYFAYNIFGHSDEYSIIEHSLKQAILLRQINKLFSNTNQVNQYMLLNGKVISVWNLLNYAAENLNNQIDALQLFITNEEKISEIASTWIGQKPNYRKAIIRSKKVNSVINSATINATLHLNKISQIFK